MENFGELQIKVPTNPKEKEEFDKNQKLEHISREKEHGDDIEIAGNYLLRVTKDGKVFSESMPLDASGKIDAKSFMDNAGRNLLESVRSVDISKEGLTKLIDGLKGKFTNLSFSLEENKDRITLTVQNTVKKDAFVQWVSQGSNQWEEPRRIVHITDDGQFAFVDGSMTGIPISQLEAIKGN